MANAAARVRVESAHSGDPTLVIDGRYVHSRHDPRREAERTMEALCRRDPAAVLLIGVGLGYAAAELLSKTDVTRVVAYEPDAAVARLAVDGPLAGYARSARLQFVSTPEELEQALPRLCSDGFETVTQPGRFASAPDTLDEIARVEAAFRGRLDINRNTLERFGRLWVRNLCRNLPRLATGIGVNALAGRLAGLPAVLVAAGPTLDQTLELLPEFARRCVIVAVDTAIAPCLRVGVTPDIAVVVDPQYWNARHLDRLMLTDTLLVSETSAHPSVFGSFASPHFFCSSVFPLGQSYEEVLGRFGPLGAGGSVATSAWDLVRLLGCDSVYVSGLDLGFPNGMTHCRDSFFERLAVGIATRTQPAERVVFRYAWDADATHVPDNVGGTLLSDRRMTIYRNWFASQIARNSLPTFAVTRGSASIPGVTRVAPDTVLRLPDARADVQTALREASRLRADERARAERIEDHSRTLRAHLAELAAIADRARDTTALLADRHAHGLGVDFSPLGEHDAAIAANPAGRIAGFLMQRAINAIGSGFGSSSIAEQIDASRTLYDTLGEASRYHAEQLARADAR